MIAPTAPSFKLGDLVTVNHPRAHGAVYRVVKVNPKSCTVEPVNGGQGVRADKALLRPHTEGAERPAAIGVPFVPRKMFVLGETVRVHGRDGVWVVIRMTDKGYSVALLGGDNDRYLRCPDSLLTAVKVTATVAE